ncbi:hypothetical protein F4680DRAFT_471915 [Xylaria scruposa]|nr:hypothetical protein F4680DRAFT_471915 [Xylaria scruposa]
MVGLGVRPFPKDYWQAVGYYLSNDSAIPVFSANTIPQQPLGSSDRPNRGIDIDANGYPRESGQHREGVVALCLGEEETPRSIWDREMLQYEKDRSKYLRIKLPKNLNVWTKFQEQRKQLTGFPSLLYEDLSKEQQCTWVPESVTAPIVEDPSQSHETNTDVVSKDTVESMHGNGKRPSPDEHQKDQPKPKKLKTFVAEHNIRDQVECVEKYDGMTKFSYHLQPEEVELLTSLLRDMLRNDPNERIIIDEVLQHEWFEASRKHFERI